jgi:hypothetical protein
MHWFDWMLLLFENIGVVTTVYSMQRKYSLYPSHGHGNREATAAINVNS